MTDFFYIDLLLAVFAIAALITRRPAAMTFVLFSLAHNYLYTDTPRQVYYLYYLADAVFAIVVMAIIALFLKPTKTATTFIGICWASFLLNAYGFILWTYYAPSMLTYNIAFVALYVLAIFVTLRGDSAKNERGSRFNLFFVAGRKSLALNGALQKETGN